MEESINYILTKYFNPIKDKIDYAVSILENNNNYDGSSYAVRNIVESIRDNSLVNLEREIDNNYPSFQKLENGLPEYVSLNELETDFKITYDNINDSIGDFLDNDMEKDSHLALNNLSELDKKIDTYRNSLIALQDMKSLDGNDIVKKADDVVDIENKSISGSEKVKTEDLNNTLDEIDNVLDDMMENKIEETYKDETQESGDISMENKIDENEEYNVDAFLKHINESKDYLDDLSRNFREENEKATNEFIEKINELNKDVEDYNLEPVDLEVDDLDVDSKLDADVIEEDKYTEKLTKLMDKFNNLVRLYEKECHKQKKNIRVLKSKETEYNHLKRNNDDKRARKVAIARHDYINEAILYTAIIRLNKKIRNSEITINELEDEIENIRQQIASPALDPQETFRNNRLTSVSDFNSVLGDHGSTVVENEEPVDIVGDTLDFIDYEEEPKKRI